MGVKEGDALITINSNYYDAEKLDVYSLMNVLKADARTMDGLSDAGVPEELIRDVTALGQSEEPQGGAAGPAPNNLFLVSGPLQNIWLLNSLQSVFLLFNSVDPGLPFLRCDLLQ